MTKVVDKQCCYDKLLYYLLIKKHMNKVLKKSLSAFLLIALCVISLPVLALPNFSTSIVGVGSAWEHGTDEHWHLQLLDEKTEFTAGEKVQFFAQAGPISENHQWNLKLYRENDLYKEVLGPCFYPDEEFAWNYTNFVPYEYDLPVGDYKAEYWLDCDSCTEEFASVDFTVNFPEEDYVFDHASTSLDWEYGIDEGYWDLKPVNATSTFSIGDKVYLMTQLRDIYKDHRYKVELYRSGTMLWDYANGWMEVGAGWDYSNFYPYYENAQPGNYEFKVYIDTGDGYKHLVSTDFVVEGSQEEYIYENTVTATGWEHGGEGEDYWNLQAVDQKTNFQTGDTVYALSQVKNIYVDHQWKVSLARKVGNIWHLMWNYETEWNQVGSGWTYGNFFPYYENAQPGSYVFAISINTGSGYEILDHAYFDVDGEIVNYEYMSTTIAPAYEHGVDENYWNLQAVDPRDSYVVGEKIYALAKLKNVYNDHRWKAELYKSGTMMWDYETSWNQVGTGWSYGNFIPYYENAQLGDYEFKIYLDMGSGFEFLDAGSFSVNYE